MDNNEGLAVIVAEKLLKRGLLKEDNCGFQLNR